jgi:hypothetical protein
MPSTGRTSSGAWKWCLARLPSDRSAHLARIDTELQIEK